MGYFLFEHPQFLREIRINVICSAGRWEIGYFPNSLLYKFSAAMYVSASYLISPSMVVGILDDFSQFKQIYNLLSIIFACL